MAATLTFRLAHVEDVTAIVGLVQSAYRGDTSRAGWTTEADLLDGQRTDAAQVSALIAQPGSAVLLALDQTGAVQGCCQLERRAEEVGYFGMFSIRPGLQGNGFGRLMLAEAERRARHELGCTRMELTVIVQRGELVAWYERRGYRRTGEVQPFPYGDERFGVPRRNDLAFAVLAKPLR